MQNRREQNLVVMICAVAMMAAVVFVGNYLRIRIPVSLGGTSAFTLANILCALAGILLGPWWGGLAAGLGSAIFDVLDPEYIVEAPITFVTKGMYGLVAGLVLYRLFKNSKDKYGPQVAATACAAVTYIILYSVKTFFFNGMLLQGLTEPVQCWLLVASKLPSSLVNGVVAVIFAPVLGTVLRPALRKAHVLAGAQ